jgi:hypothetical protein
VFGPTIDSIQHELLPSLSGGALEPDREALVRSAVGRLLMQFGDYDAGLVQLERAVDQLPARSVPRAASLLWLGWPYGSPHPVSWHLDQVRRAVAAIPDDLAPADRLMLDRLHVTRLLFLGDDEGWAMVDRIPDRADDQDVALQAVLGHADLAYAALLWGRYQQADEHVRVTEQLSERWYFEGSPTPCSRPGSNLDWYVGRWQGLAERAQALDQRRDTTGSARLESLLVTSRLSTACGLPERAGTGPRAAARRGDAARGARAARPGCHEAGQRRLGRGDPWGGRGDRRPDGRGPRITELATRRWRSCPGASRRWWRPVAGARRPLCSTTSRPGRRARPRTPGGALALCRGLILEQGDPEGAAAESAPPPTH